MPPMLTEVLTRISMVNQYFAQLEAANANSASNANAADTEIGEDGALVSHMDAMGSGGPTYDTVRNESGFTQVADSVPQDLEGTVEAADEMATKRARVQESSAVPAAGESSVGLTPVVPPTNSHQAASGSDGSAMEALAFAASMFSTNIKNAHII